jgi:acyl-CoA synthetase (AMP-forming)/AMP-acid ligase II
LGRKSDLLIVAGKNLFPEDIEAVVSEVAGVLPGRVVAFGVDDALLGTQQVAVIAETEAAKSGHAALELAIKQAALAIDISIRQVFLAPPRWLIKSSAGKPSRSANRQRIGELT